MKYIENVLKPVFLTIAITTGMAIIIVVRKDVIEWMNLL